MDPKHTTEETLTGAEERRSDNWFATFSFLDVGSAISSSQLRRLVATVSKLWRLTLGYSGRRRCPTSTHQ